MVTARAAAYAKKYNPYVCVYQVCRIYLAQVGSVRGGRRTDPFAKSCCIYLPELYRLFHA